MDASGHGTVVGRHLGIRKNFEDPNLQKVAYFQHFDNVERLPSNESGHPTIFMADEGWFWVIGLNDRVTSVGFVTRPSFVKQLSIQPDRLLQWAIQRCPVLRHRMRNASGPADNHVLANFSYKCSPQARPGYFLVGDAGAFLDPIFSTGVSLAMIGGNHGAKARGENAAWRDVPPKAARKDYISFVEGGARLALVDDPPLLQPLVPRPVPLRPRPARRPPRVISILAGNVFPKPLWKLRWRMYLFQFFEFWNRYVQNRALKRSQFSLLGETPQPLPLIAAEPAMAMAGV